MVTLQKLRLSCAVALLFASLPVSAGGPKYRKLVLTPLPSSDSNPSAQKERPVQLNASIVPDKPAGPKASQQFVYLELFRDAKFNTSLQQSCTEAGCSWVGTIDKQPGSTVILLRKDADSMVGNVRDANGRTFQIQPQQTETGSATRGKHVILRTPPQVFPDERSPESIPPPPRPVPDAPPRSSGDPAPDAKPGQKAAPADPNHSSNDVAQLNVLVLYTKNARSAVEGPASAAHGAKTIKDEIRLAAEMANQSFKNSDIKISLNVVAMKQVDYDEVSSGDPFSAALGSLSEADGPFENVFALKEKYRAHLVSLWISEKPDAVMPTSCGLGYLLEGPVQSFGPYAFNVVHALCGLANFSFAHEIGHNLGAQHNREAEVDPSRGAYNFGYIPPSHKFRCVMSYACASATDGAPCVRQPIWSNPSHDWLGEKTGVEEGTDGAADNARELNENRFIAADNWRPDSPGARSDILGQRSPASPDQRPGSYKFIITNASRNGIEECLIMNGNGQAASPSRYLWGGGSNGYCGMASNAELLSNKQAVWTAKPLGDNKYLLTNASRNGTEECLIMGGNGQATFPTRYLWGGGANGFCGLGSLEEVLANKQAVWKVIPLGDDKYVITNDSRNGTEECLIFSGNGWETNPRRYLWGGGPNGHCGQASDAELLANKQAVWTFTPLP